MNFGERHVYMEGEAGAAGGGDGGAGAAAGAAGGAGGAAAGQSGAAAGTGAAAGGEGNPAGSALSAAGAGEWTPASIPEKYRVMGDDGELDITASFRKVDEHRAQLEKRMGSGDIRPKTPDEYKLPDTDVFKGLQLDEAGAKAFRQEAHDMGLSQKQYEGIMAKWATLAPELVNAGQAETAATATAALKEAWKDDGEYKANLTAAFSAATRVGEAAGFSAEEVDKAIGNNPVAIRMFAALSKEMGEDKSSAAANGGTGGAGQSSADYLNENFAAYSDPKDPKHKTVTERYNALLGREAKREPAAT